MVQLLACNLQRKGGYSVNNRLSIKLMNYNISIALERDYDISKYQLEEYILNQRIEEERKKSIMPDFDSIRAYYR